MNIYSILFVSIILCALYCCVILVFPETYKKTSAKTGINILIYLSVLSYCIALTLLYNYRNINILAKQIDAKVALIIILSITVLLFTVNILCPAFCIMVKQNQKETETATQFNRLIFQYKYQSDKRTESIEQLTVFQEVNKKFLCEYGIELYVPELIKQSNNVVHLAPEKLINTLEDYSIKILKETTEYTPNPFSNSSVVFSFGISTLLTLILSYVAIMP